MRRKKKKLQLLNRVKERFRRTATNQSLPICMMIEMHLPNDGSMMFYLPPEQWVFQSSPSWKTKELTQRATDHTVFLFINIFLHCLLFLFASHNIFLLLCECWYLEVTFEIARGLLVTCTDLLLCTQATIEIAINRQMGEGEGEREIERERERERKKETDRETEIINQIEPYGSDQQ